MTSLSILCAFLATGAIALPVSAATKKPATPEDPQKKRVEMLQAQPLDTHTLFDGDKFPEIDFYNKNLVTAAIGSYSWKIRFFDAKWNEVTTPKEPGRYGALLTLKSAHGAAITRHLTLFKTPQHYDGAKETYGVPLKFPAAFGLTDDVLAREQWNINNAAGEIIGESEDVDDHAARLVAALQDLTDDPTRWHGFNASFIDAAWWSELQKRQGEDQDYQRLIYTPDGYAADKKTWPLLVFLHGSGERGHDLKAVKKFGPLAFIEKGHPLPFIVATPQCPDDERWDPARIARLIDDVSAKYRVDPKRVYVTGLSLGGYASFEMAAMYPDKIAAIAPLSGGENPALAERMGKMPAWIFHGADDTVVPARYSTDLAAALEKVGAPVKLTLYPGVGHGGWEVTYADPTLYTWFLAQSK